MPRTGDMPVFALVALVLQAGCSGADARTEAKADSPAGHVTAGTTRGTALREIDWKAVDAAMGRTSSEQPGNVRRYGMPRSDMRVTVQRVSIKPGFALGSWLAMTPHGDSAGQPRVLTMGDMVLKEGEVGPVMTALQAGADARDLDTAAVSLALGRAGKVNGGVYQVSVPRAETIRDGGVEVPASMGLATAINFQPTGGGKAAITGDFVMIAAEVNPVIRALSEHGIEVTSLHNHLLADEPQLFFMHFWADDDAAKLARGLRAALDRTNSRRE
jgi:hypothetical protein